MERSIILVLGILLLSPLVLSIDITVCSIGCNFTLIQDAINNASNGDNILVSAGTYNENQIVINKRLKVIGAGADTTIIDGGNSLLTETGLIRIIANGDVDFKGFTIRNAGGVSNIGDGNDDQTNVGIYTQSSSSSSDYVISENKIYGTNNANDEEDYGFYSNSGRERLVFLNNSIRETGANPILLEKHTGSVNIENNNLDVGAYGIDTIFAMTYGGVDINSLYSIKNNYFDLGTGFFDHGAAAISIASSYKNPPYILDLGDGEFSNIEISGNTIANLKQNRSGITLWNGDLTDGLGGEITGIIFNNTLTGENAAGSRGISLLGKTTNVEILENNIENLWRGVWITDSITGGIHYSENARVNYNSFEGNDYGLIWDGIDTLDAEYNWWGDCAGPSGDDITGLGELDVDFTPWIGVCIENKTETSCVFKDGNLTLGADLEGEDIVKAWIWTLINGTEKNYTAFPFGNNYRATIPSWDLIGEQNVSWNVYAEDAYGRTYTNGERSFYVINDTFLGINPYPANGNNGWYVSEPVFSLVPDIAWVQSYYQWDNDDVFVYTGPFDLEDIPNEGGPTGIESAGTLELNWWAEFNCSGSITAEPKQTTIMYVDLTNPRINETYPLNGSIISNPDPKASVLIDEVYQSNSGVNESSISIILDGDEAINTFSTENITATKTILEFNLTALETGSHNLSVYVEDNSGRSSSKTWSFEVEELEDLGLDVTSPEEIDYGSKRILFNITTQEEVDRIEYINYNDKRPRWQRLCRECDSYERLKTLNEGENNITVKAVGSQDNVEEAAISLFIDSIKPRVSRISPKKNSVTNGNDFYIRYTEVNLKRIELFWNGSQAFNCSSGANQECFASVNLSDHDNETIEYWWVLNDSINQINTSKISVRVDTTPPNITLYMPQDATYNSTKVPFNISISEEVILDYMDLWDELPKWKRLCISCEEYGLNKEKTKSFKKGIHDLLIRATDEAGNTDTESVGFLVDY